MKIFRFQILLIVLFALSIMSCENEIIPSVNEKEIIQEISKTWSCEMFEDGTPYSGFEITISSVARDETRINISNFHKSGETVYAFVSDDLMITIPEQQVGEQYFKGTGEISNDYSRISWNYTVENAGGIVVVTGVSSNGGNA